ncbi:MAG: ParB/RepB/Spo0J family partition protein [Chlorobi bacterium]|nr:ParB/RepB/Spo0J family partition protein [Chlorobiota bacterium]
MGKRNVLGRGLGALIDDANKMNEGGGHGTYDVEMSLIEVNPFQPRSNFNSEALEELSISIKEIGLIQPLTLRKAAENRYQIIAGERRFRAAQMAGLKRIPAYVREANDDSMLEMALVENIQREDLDAIEIAFSYHRLIEECNLTQEELSSRVGKKRSTIANYLRLLKLPPLIQKGIREKHITMGHARALVNIEDADTQVDIFEQTVKNDYSVRKVEEIVSSLNRGKRGSTTAQGKASIPEKYLAVKKSLSGFFRSPVSFSINNKGKGKIVIPFKSVDDFERIVELLKKQE